MSLLGAKGIYSPWCAGKIGGVVGLTLRGLENQWTDGSSEMPSSNFIVHQNPDVSSPLKTNLKALSNCPFTGALRPRASMASDRGHFFLIFHFALLASSLWEEQMFVTRTAPCRWCFGVRLSPDSWLWGWENPRIPALCFPLPTPRLCLPTWHAFSAFPDVTLLSLKQNSEYPLYSYTFTETITKHLW